ncbi:MarR family winged helix-turn-helix transcriptional regulator [Streptomyces sp. NPDC127068]|uniref:MarR family winged helix-turn-helix transcriptional regulator n=1 Tax=Streptomyces sp. NPDC127068 TaxID=3347127 RepID=UPI00365E7532
MNDVQKSSDDLARDERGLLYNPGARASMSAFALDGDTLALEAVAALRSALQAVDRLRARGAGNRGLSTGALDVLMRLGVAPDEGVTVGELARAGGVSSRNVTGLVDTLERDGLAARVPDRQDRRAVRVQITPRGRTWLDDFRLPARRAMESLFRGVEPDDVAALRHLCLSLVENQRRVERYLEGGGATGRVVG